jgi:repressor LexA
VPDPLTPLERSVYQFLVDFLAENTFQPSMREVGRRFGIGSTKTVMELYKRLETKGYIERGVAQSRGVRLIGYPGPGGTQPVPLFARAHATPPTLRPEDVVTRMTLDRRLVPTSHAFLARVLGDGAQSHSARDGDLAVIDPSGRAADGDLVAIRIGDAIHVRAIEHDGAALVVRALHGADNHVVLVPGDDYAVLGTVAAVVRPPV